MATIKQMDIYKRNNFELCGCNEQHVRLINAIRDLDKSSVLDIGERNPLTILMENEFNIKISNTDTDLDYGIRIKKKYTLIILSHVIEHLMNPLLLLEDIWTLLTDDGMLVVAYPVSIIKSLYHYHEIPERDMKALIDKADYEIVHWLTVGVKGHGFGIRPLLRSFFDKNHIITLKRR